MGGVAAQYVEVLSKNFALTAFVADRDRILVAAGSGRRAEPDGDAAGCTMAAGKQELEACEKPVQHQRGAESLRRAER